MVVVVVVGGGGTCSLSARPGGDLKVLSAISISGTYTRTTEVQ